MRDFNDTSRVAWIMSKLGQQMEARRNEFSELRSDPERMNRVLADLGEVAHAVDAGVANAADLIDRPLVDLLLWREAAERERAW